jgi:hypothetical protein
MEKIFDNLYARTSSGKINVWEVIAKVLSNNESGILILEGGFDDKKTESWRKTTSKNVGKMNATTAYEQACSEAESRWTKKKKQFVFHYFFI